MKKTNMCEYIAYVRLLKSASYFRFSKAPHMHFRCSRGGAVSRSRTHATFYEGEESSSPTEKDMFIKGFR